MKHDLSLRGEIFNDAVELFDLKLHDVLNTLLRQGLTDGCVTLKLNVELWTVGEQDEDGVYHDTNKTHFDYNRYGGAPILGASKPVFKAHGSAKAVTVKNAIRLSVEYVKANAIEAISSSL